MAFEEIRVNSVAGPAGLGIRSNLIEYRPNNIE